MQHVPYRGIVLAIQDMLADRIQVIFGNAPDVAPHIEAGKMKALAVVGPRRLDSMPNVPSMVELGLPQINVPVGTVDGCPVGLGLIGWRGGDEALLDLAVLLGARCGQVG